MEVLILKDSAAVAFTGANIVRELLHERPKAVLGLASGRTPRELYRLLIQKHREGDLSFREATTFNLDEYLGLPLGDPRSYRAYMQRELFDHVDIDTANTFLPECSDGSDPLQAGPAFEALIRARGGIDLQILGIGTNGHIGFNEPTSSLRSRTRIKTLTQETVAANSQYFDDPVEQPTTALTMGIASIMDARRILLLATGREKAHAVRQLIEGPVSAMCPASILQMHETVTILLDEAAAAELTLRDYFLWVAEQKAHLAAG